MGSSADIHRVAGRSRSLVVGDFEPRDVQVGHGVQVESLRTAPGAIEDGAWLALVSDVRTWGTRARRNRLVVPACAHNNGITGLHHGGSTCDRTPRLCSTAGK